jgi:hypothetical protein
MGLVSDEQHLVAELSKACQCSLNMLVCWVRNHSFNTEVTDAHEADVSCRCCLTECVGVQLSPTACATDTTIRPPLELIH